MTLPFHITYLLRSIKAICASLRFWVFPSFVSAPLKDVCDHKATRVRAHEIQNACDSKADMSVASGERSEVTTHDVQRWTICVSETSLPQVEQPAITGRGN